MALDEPHLVGSLIEEAGRFTLRDFRPGSIGILHRQIFAGSDTAICRTGRLSNDGTFENIGEAGTRRRNELARRRIEREQLRRGNCDLSAEDPKLSAIDLAAEHGLVVFNDWHGLDSFPKRKKGWKAHPFLMKNDSD
jgi:hypothetical protein